ncbi:MAG: hypothetical protein A2Z69_00320 [Bacteroidetes bacterium RBG_13_44_24]|nr:MAG: hypothetical protein A2Z69_00320 [Bacteroidetes bacterium RBG_13_44_24]
MGKIGLGRNKEGEMIKCRCGRDDCEGKIWFEPSRGGHTVVLSLEIDDVAGQPYSIHLDANGLIDLKREIINQLFELGGREK